MADIYIWILKEGVAKVPRCERHGMLLPPGGEIRSRFTTFSAGPVQIPPGSQTENEASYLQVGSGMIN